MKRIQEEKQRLCEEEGIQCRQNRTARIQGDPGRIVADIKAEVVMNEIIPHELIDHTGT